MSEFAVGDRVRFTSPEFEDMRIFRGDTGTIAEIKHGALCIAWDKEDHRDSPTPWAPDHFEKITPRVGHDAFQPGDKVKWRAGRTGRASRIGEVISTGVDMDGASFAKVTTPSGIEKTYLYAELEMVRPVEAKMKPSTTTPQQRRQPVTLRFSYEPDEHIPFIRDLDNLLEILSESPDDLTITEEPS